MPTSEDAPTAELLQKILPLMLKTAGETGWTEETYRRVLAEAGVDISRAALSLPNGVASLVESYLNASLAKVQTRLAELALSDMRIRERVSAGVQLWLEYLSQHHTASVRALDWVTAHPLGPLPPTELVWQLADTIWTGIGDTSTGFTYMSKRTILSGVIASTLAVWRRDTGERPAWPAFLDRRIEDVMAFERLKAKFRFPLPA